MQLCCDCSTTRSPLKGRCPLALGAPGCPCLSVCPRCPCLSHVSLSVCPRCPWVSPCVHQPDPKLIFSPAFTSPTFLRHSPVSSGSGRGARAGGTEGRLPGTHPEPSPPLPCCLWSLLHSWILTWEPALPRGASLGHTDSAPQARGAALLLNVSSLIAAHQEKEPEAVTVSGGRREPLAQPQPCSIPLPAGCAALAGTEKLLVLGTATSSHCPGHPSTSLSPPKCDLKL